MQLDRDELADVDVHPLVRADMDVTMLIADLFMAKSGIDGPLCEYTPPHLSSTMDRVLTTDNGK